MTFEWCRFPKLGGDQFFIILGHQHGTQLRFCLRLSQLPMGICSHVPTPSGTAQLPSIAENPSPILHSSTAYPLYTNFRSHPPHLFSGFEDGEGHHQESEPEWEEEVSHQPEVGKLRTRYAMATNNAKRGREHSTFFTNTEMRQSGVWPGKIL